MVLNLLWLPEYFPEEETFFTSREVARGRAVIYEFVEVARGRALVSFFLYGIRTVFTQKYGCRSKLHDSTPKSTGVES